MKAIFGETKQLRASERNALEKLALKRSNPKALIDTELAKRAASLCAQLGLQIGLLLARDGRVEQVILGQRDRIYLPDLGRYRLNKARLRRLRFVVFLPPGQHNLAKHRADLSFSSARDANDTREISTPEIAGDLITDLEKLRFDALLAVAAEENGSPGPVSLAYLDPSKPVPQNFRSLAGIVARGIRFAAFRTVYDIELDFDQFVEDLESRFAAVRPQGFDTSADKAILVGAYTEPQAVIQASMDELVELARTAGIEILDTFIQRRRSLDPKSLIGKGKLEELVLHSLDLGADLLVFDRELSPGQLRIITNLTELRVIDRSMLILDIFAQRAVTSEGRLQVELAQLRYSLPRLTEKDSGLSRLTGGIGGRGPGETKLEISRRRARKRIADLEKRITKLAQQRGLRRERRQSRGVPVIAIVGYTNAGKSTLLNSLTKGEVIVENKLFATLDPASRRMRFPNDKEVIFVDTVGFIRELPKELVSAFRATLEEVGEADFLVHLLDASNPELPKQHEVVVNTLESLGFGDKPRLLVFNKVDLLSPLELRALQNTYGGLAVSAVTREGFEDFVVALQEELSRCFQGQDPGRFTEITPW